MPYSTCRQLLALIPNLTNNSGSIDNMGADITPGSAQLLDFLSSGCALIHTKLTSLGYSVPATSGDIIYDFLSQLNAQYGAWQAEAARSSARVSTRERSRASMFQKMFSDGLDALGDMDLTLAGLDQSTAEPGWYIGGISQAEKDSVEGDTDRVDSRFSRGQFKNAAAPYTQRSAS